MIFKERLHFSAGNTANWESYVEIFKETLCLSAGNTANHTIQMPNTSLNFQLSHTTTMKSFVWLVQTVPRRFIFNGTYADGIKGPYC